MNELLPCPFCGSKDLETNRAGEALDGFCVQCNSCSAEGPFRPTEAEAEQDWNKRDAQRR